MTCHDICQTSNPMPRVRSLLGLGFNFCLRKQTPSMDITKTMNRLRYDMRHIYFFKIQMEEEEEEGQYIRGLYIKSNWGQSLASKEFECKLDNFEKILTTLNKSHSRYVGSNLTLNQQHICSDIHDSQTHPDWQSNKNMGPVWCDTEL